MRGAASNTYNLLSIHGCPKHKHITPSPFWQYFPVPGVDPVPARAWGSLGRRVPHWFSQF